MTTVPVLSPARNETAPLPGHRTHAPINAHHGLRPVWQALPLTEFDCLRDEACGSILPLRWRIDESLNPCRLLVPDRNLGPGYSPAGGYGRQCTKVHVAGHAEDCGLGLLRFRGATRAAHSLR